VRREDGALQALQEDIAALCLPELRQAGALVSKVFLWDKLQS
jgi:hypothetical protein